MRIRARYLGAHELYHTGFSHYKINFVALQQGKDRSIEPWVLFHEGEVATNLGGIGDKPTAEANKRVTEVIEQQRSTRKRKAIAYPEEARAKIGKYASNNGIASARRHFRNELGDLPESTVQKYKQLYENQLFARATRGDMN